MWPSNHAEPTFEDIAQLLRWSRAQRISLDTDDLPSFDDDDLFAYTTRRTRPRYKSERRRPHRERDER